MRNWTIKDAVAVIQNGRDTEAIKEIAKHFPVFFMAVAKNDLGAVAAMMTDKMTVRRLQAEAAEADEDADEAEEVEAADDADTSDGGEDLESMSTKQLIELCGKRGIKVPKYGKNKAFYIAALQDGGEEAEAEDDGDDDAEDDPYAGKNAIQLYSLCKKRGLKVKPKQKAAVYLEALKKADAAASEDADDDQDDDWGEDDEEAEEKKPAKKSAKKAPAKKSTSKKATKKAEPEPEEDEDDGDDDDDWEI